MLIHFSDNFGSRWRFVYEVGGVDRGGSSGSGSGESGENIKAAKERRERITGLENLDALGLLGKGQTEELAVLRQAEAATKATKKKADQARAALARAEKAREPASATAPVPARKPGNAMEESEEPEDGLELVQAGENELEPLRREIEDMVYYYREGNDDATTEGLLGLLSDSYGISPDKLKAHGVTLKSSDKAISSAAIKALAADDTGQG